MGKNIFCKKLESEEEALDYTPLPGDIGKEIHENISKKAWQMWLGRQTMLINEYRLNMLDQDAREFLMAEMKKFLFTDESETPPGYKPVE